MEKNLFIDASHPNETRVVLKSENNIEDYEYESLNNTLIKNKTTIVIAHRLSTILNANNIYLIDKGKVVENGKHKDLLYKSEIYKRFYKDYSKKF